MDQGCIIAAGTPAELIERYVGREVIEVFTGGDPRRRAAVLAALRSFAAHVEEIGDAVVVHLNEHADPRPILTALAARSWCTGVRRWRTSSCA